MAKEILSSDQRNDERIRLASKEFPDQPIREGRTMEDPDFPRIAITYSMDENAASAKEKQDEMQQIISRIQ